MHKQTCNEERPDLIAWLIVMEPLGKPDTPYQVYNVNQATVICC